MNYIRLINRFWLCNMEHPFTSNDTRLYFYLLHTCNQLGWKMPFGHSDRHLSAMTGMSVPTVRDCKKRLVQRGLITIIIPDIKSKSFNGQTSYSFPSTVQTICTVPLTDGLTDTCTEGLTNTIQDQTKQENNNTPKSPLDEISFSGRNNEPEKNKHEKLNSPGTDGRREKVPQKEENVFLPFVLPFSSECFTDAWDTLLQLPKWRNKEPASLRMALKKLSGFEEEFSVSLIENTISNNWQGVVFPDTELKYQQWKQNKHQYGNKTVNQRSAAFANCVVETCQPSRDYKERL